MNEMDRLLAAYHARPDEANEEQDQEHMEIRTDYLAASAKSEEMEEQSDALLRKQSLEQQLAWLRRARARARAERDVALNAADLLNRGRGELVEALGGG